MPKSRHAEERRNAYKAHACRRPLCSCPARFTGHTRYCGASVNIDRCGETFAKRGTALYTFRMGVVYQVRQGGYLQHGRRRFSTYNTCAAWVHGSFHCTAALRSFFCPLPSSVPPSACTRGDTHSVSMQRRGVAGLVGGGVGGGGRLIRSSAWTWWRWHKDTGRTCRIDIGSKFANEKRRISVGLFWRPLSGQTFGPTIE